MQTSESRRGIEWKILRSILWVGILPLTVALAAGYVAARRGQTSATEQTLLAATEGKAVALRLSAEFRLKSAGELAQEEEITDALRPGDDARPRFLSDPPTEARLKKRLERVARATSDRLSVWTVYDPSGAPLLSTNPAAIGDRHIPKWVTKVTQPTFVEVEFLPSQDIYTAQTVAPIFGDSGRLDGFICELFDLHSLVMHTLTTPGFDDPRGLQDIRFQIIYPTRQGLLAASLSPARAGNEENLQIVPLDQALAEVLRNPKTPPSSSRIQHNYSVAMEQQRDVFLAYVRPFPTENVFVVAYMPLTQVYRVVNLGALAAIGICFLFIGFMCVNAYRHVHNNIVRPVLLLNEGAQIIGQGDLELKLKIGTGDEIEELAASFNSMALALKHNIGQLEESEEKYRSLVTSMRDGIFQADANGTIGFMNPAGAEIFGLARDEEPAGLNLGSLFLEEDEMQPILAELEREGYVERSRVWMKRRDGRAICVELSANQMHDDDRRVAGIEGIFRDVTKSVRLEREARDRAERLAAINQIANVINSSLEVGRLYESLVVEVKKLVDFDQASLALLNDQRDAFVTHALWPEHALDPALNQSIDDDRSCAAWVARRRQCLVVDDLSAPGTPFTPQFPASIRSCVSVPLYATGRIIGTLNLGSMHANGFSHHDVEVLEQMAPHVAVAIRNAQLLENLQQSLEEVTRAREKLHEANEELKTLDEMKTNLLSNVSHELRTPLVSIMGYTDMIYNGKAGPVTDTQREYLSISLRNVDKLVTLIENLLDFSRLHRGAETLVFDTLDLVDVARSSLQIIQPVADGRDIRLILDAPEEPISVEGDKGKLGQVFNNLLSNAVKFNHNGGSVTVRVRPAGDSVECSVSDTGIGIPPEALDKIFTRFYQYDSSSTRKYGGTGIGLSIAQDIVRLHGSRIVTSSELGEGATFRFALPLRAARRGEGGEMIEAETPTETHLLIELVTQDRALITQVRNLLVPEGMDVIHAAGSAHAIALAGRHHPDCILADIEGDDRMLSELVQHPVLGQAPLILLTNDDALYQRYRPLVAARIKRSFRKSTLLSSVHYAVRRDEAQERTLGDRVLCVDDDAEVLMFIRRLLEGEGYPVDTCTSGEEALEMAMSGRYGLVLLDVAMPGIDGWETCRQIKASPALAGIKVYMVTAKPIETGGVRGNDADGYLLKPFRGEDLSELLRALDLPQTSRES